MPVIRQIDSLDDKAEGLCAGLPYNTELAGPNGVSIHFWVGALRDDRKLQAALHAACNARDIVRATWSLGEPAGFWAHQDID